MAVSTISQAGLDAPISLTSPTLTTPNIDSAQIPTVSGTAPLYMARAWVNFNGTGTVAIRQSGNVTSITDNGTGNYTVNFTTAMADADYSFVASCGNGDNAGMMASPQSATFATGSARFVTRYHDNGAADSLMTLVAVFR